MACREGGSLLHAVDLGEGARSGAAGAALALPAGTASNLPRLLLRAQARR